jgi:H+/Cl- antiporter ClcA
VLAAYGGNKGGSARFAASLLRTRNAGRLRRLKRLPLVSPRQWLRRLVFWVGAVLVAVTAIGFAWAADRASGLFESITGTYPWLALIIAPAGLVLSVGLTLRIFPGAQGSGIPQTIAAIHLNEASAVSRMLSPRIAIGKVLLTLLGLASGASIGREGPTVQVGATIMHTLGEWLQLPHRNMRRGLILAGGAAGIAAAFNTPLAGVVFAIEELSHSFEARTSGVVFTAVVIAGATTLGLVGNYTYFGHTSAQLDLLTSLSSILLCSVVGGLIGGLFSASLILAARGLPGPVGALVIRHPLGYAALCGLLIAVLGLVSHGQTYGTGYAQARSIVEGHSDLVWGYPLLKLLANIVSYFSGIPGGIFAPSLAVGAGLGDWLSHILPAPTGAVVLLGMVAYFSGVVQAPITATIIVMEMTDNQQMTVPLMAASFMAFGVSRLVCRRPLYSELAQRFLHAQHRARHPRPDRQIETPIPIAPEEGPSTTPSLGPSSVEPAAEGPNAPP